MPKTKKKSETSSDSDSGPDDKIPPPAAKKSKKVDTEVSKDSRPKRSETNWTLEQLRQVNINEFRGRKTVDIREFYQKDGKTLPGKKGISLTPTQWRKLLEIADEVTAALENE